MKMRKIKNEHLNDKSTCNTSVSKKAFSALFSLFVIRVRKKCDESSCVTKSSVDRRFYRGLFPSSNLIATEIMNCSICLKSLELREEIVSTQCDHCFHKNCLVVWIRKSETCPNCRERPMPLRKVFLKYFNTISSKEEQYIKKVINNMENHHEDLKKEIESCRKMLEEIESDLLRKFREYNHNDEVNES
jgi:Ring finger domain